jgi:hypothetical protein
MVEKPRAYAMAPLLDCPMEISMGFSMEIVMA